MRDHLRALGVVGVIVAVIVFIALAPKLFAWAVIGVMCGAAYWLIYEIMRRFV